MGVFRFIRANAETIFWLTLLVVAFGGLGTVFHITGVASEARHQRELATDYDVYCVAKSGEVLFDEQVADATAHGGQVIIRHVDYSQDYITVVGDCKIVPVRKS